MPDFVSFDDFVERSQASKYEHHRATLQWAAAKAGLTAHTDDVGEAEFDKMKKFVLDHYDGVKAQHSFLDSAGNHFDCIPFDQVPMVRSAKAAGQTIQEVGPPPPQVPAGAPDPKFPTNPIKPPLGQGAVDMYGHPLVCPDGCVALRRTSVERISLSGNFERYFRKGHGRQFRKPGAQAAAAPTAAAPTAIAPNVLVSPHQYATVQDATGAGTQYSGAGSYFNIWSPNPGTDGMSLSQLWIVGGDFNVQDVDPSVNSDVLQTIESGWMVQSDVFSTMFPVIFVYFNPDGYLVGQNIPGQGRGGYLTNQDHFGFIPSPNVQWPIGGAFAQSNISTMGGSQCEFWMSWTRDSTTGNWFLFMGPTPSTATQIGYFDKSLYGAGALGVGPASTIQFGGEVAPAFVGTPMGSGNAPTGNPTSDYQTVAYQRDVAIQVAGNASMAAAALAPSNVDNPPYNLSIASSPNWNSYFFFGG